MKNICLLMIVAVFCSCSFLLGIKQPKLLSTQQIIKAQQELNIRSLNTFYLDTDYWNAIKNCSPSEQNHHLQPLQILFYKKDDCLHSFYINCNAGLNGFKLNWNKNGILDSFYYKTATENDSCITLNQQLNNIKPINESRIILDNTYDIIAIVYWNKFMLKQSKNMIRQYLLALQKNARIKVLTIYVNNDNIFLK